MGYDRADRLVKQIKFGEWTTEELENLIFYLDEVLRKNQGVPGPVRPEERKETIEERYIRCGKKQCRVCNIGRGHGPYRYRRIYDPATKRTRHEYLKD